MTQLEKTLLFAKPLTFTSTASIDDCMKRFKSHDVRWERLFQSSTTVVTLNRISETFCELDMRAKRFGHRADNTTAHVIGILEAKSNGNSDFHGHIKLGIFYLVIIGWNAILFLIITTSYGFNPIILFLGIAITGYLIFAILNDRKRLIQAVQTAMATGHDVDH